MSIRGSGALFPVLTGRTRDLTDEEYVAFFRTIVKNKRYISAGLKAIGFALLVISVIILVYIFMLFRLAWEFGVDASQISAMASGVILGVLPAMALSLTVMAFRMSHISRTEELMVKYFDLYTKRLEEAAQQH